MSDDGEDASGGSHGGMGCLAAAAMILSGAAPFLRSCDEAADLAKIGRNSSRHLDRFGPVSRGGDDVMMFGRHALLPESKGLTISNDDLAKIAAVEPEDIGRFSDDLTPQYARVADPADIHAGMAKAIFKTRRYDPTMRMLYAAPADGDEFRRIFGYSPSRSEIDAVMRARKGLGDFQRSRPVTSADDLLNELSDGDDSIFIVVGHNEGGMLRMADGSQVDLLTLSRSCEENGKLCVVLSCHSNRYIGSTTTRGIDDAITYQEAEKIGREIDDIFDQIADRPRDPASGYAIRVSQVDALIKIGLQRGVAKNRSYKRVKRAGKLVGFSTSGGLILYEMNAE